MFFFYLRRWGLAFVYKKHAHIYREEQNVSATVACCKVTVFEPPWPLWAMYCLIAYVARKQATVA